MIKKIYILITVKLDLIIIEYSIKKAEKNLDNIKWWKHFSRTRRHLIKAKAKMSKLKELENDN